MQKFLELQRHFTELLDGMNVSCTMYENPESSERRRIVIYTFNISDILDVFITADTYTMHQTPLREYAIDILAGVFKTYLRNK